jgi:hypothetical protein
MARGLVAGAVVDQKGSFIDAASPVIVTELTGELRATAAEAAANDWRHRRRNLAREDDPAS